MLGCMPALDRTLPNCPSDGPDHRRVEGILMYPDGSVHTVKDGQVQSRDADGQTAGDGSPDATVDLLPPVDLAPVPDTFAGKWYQANLANCATFCPTLGLSNAPGPEGAHCMSGEVRSASGILQGITFTYGCWPSSCPPKSTPHQATSQSIYCYMPGQKQDNDPSDFTVGCFCRP